MEENSALCLCKDLPRRQGEKSDPSSWELKAFVIREQMLTVYGSLTKMGHLVTEDRIHRHFHLMAGYGSLVVTGSVGVSEFLPPRLEGSKTKEYMTLLMCRMKLQCS